MDEPRKKLKVRSFIVPSKDHILIQCDLSQAESWVVAFSAKEENMIWSLTKSEIHINTAEFFDNLPIGSTEKSVWKSGLGKLKRYTAKRCNHAFAYQMKGPMFMSIYNKDAVDMQIDAISSKQANDLRNRWLSRYNLKMWWKEIEYLLNERRTLVNAYGRSRSFFAAWGDELFREATAYGPQSSVADHFNGMVQDELGIKGGLLSLWEYWKEEKSVGEQIKFINQSHDSCIVDIHPSLKDDYIESVMKFIKRPMVIHGTEFTIPVSIEIGERNGELEEIKI